MSNTRMIAMLPALLLLWPHTASSQESRGSITGKVTDPQGPINPISPVSSACTGCHVTIPTASHALTNTTVLGESCATCHGPNADFSVAKEHAQY